MIVNPCERGLVSDGLCAQNDDEGGGEATPNRANAYYFGN